jgi:squalene-associated FAD-dependent desaturase
MSRSVAVVGGGLAGISAALACADAGADVVLLERRARLGGLTWSSRRNGLWFDNGQHVFMRCCTEYRALLGRLGVADLVVLQDRMTVPVLGPNGTTSVIRRSALPAPFHLGASLLRYRHLPMRDRLGLGPAVRALMKVDPDDPATDTTTFGAWLRAHHQSPRAISALWDLIILPTVNLHADEASLALAARVFRTGLLDDSAAGDIGWSRVPLQQLHGDAAARALDAAGVEVALSAPVERIDGTTVIAGGRAVGADAVIIAVPHDVAEALLPPGVLETPEQLGASAIVNVHVVLDRRVTDLPMAAVVDSPLQFVFDRSDSAGLPRTEGQCLAVSLSAAGTYLAWPTSELVRQITDALGEVFPAARHATVRDASVVREPRATFRGAPGTARLRPAATTPVPGLFVAGAWAATGWPATMEGAVRSGRSAARAALSMDEAGLSFEQAAPVRLGGSQ